MSYLILACSLLLSSSLLAKELKTISSSGSATVSLQSSLALLSVSIKVQGKEAAGVQGKLKSRSQSLVMALKKANVKKLATDRYRIYAESRSNKQNKRRIGFEGTTTVSFQVSAGKAGELLDLALRSGANEIKNISFTASKEAMAKAKLEALSQASANALSKGKHVLKSLGLRFKEVHSITVDQGHSGPRPYSLSLRSAREGSTPIEAQDVEVRAQVTTILSF